MVFDAEEATAITLIFFLGAIIGSFLNVIIYRWPREESVILPRSRCFQCKCPLPFYLNVPIFSWLALKGRAQCCGAKISLRYPLVEFLTGALFALTLYKFGWSFETVEYCVFITMAVPCFFIDLEHYLLPDVLTLPGVVIAFGGSFLSLERSPVDSFLGLIFGGGMFWAISWFYEKYRHKEGMGFGDVKLIAWLGALGGFSSVPFIMWVSAVSGTLVGLFLILFKGGSRNSALPFGPFLISSGFVYFYFIEDLKEVFPYFVGFWL